VVSAHQASEAAATDARELIGTWVEFWAVTGRADTQSYMFGADSSFEWRAARAAGTSGPTLRAGTFRLEGGALILTITREEPAMKPAHRGDERLPLGACPPDQEARAIDASYRCLSFNGRAFWRRP
jgi:hypothetical protein